LTIKDNIEKGKNAKKLEDEENEKQSIQLIKEDKNDNSIGEKTVVVYGEDKTTKLFVQTLNNAKDRWDNYADSQGPTVAMGVEQLRKGMRHAYKRGVKIKYTS